MQNADNMLIAQKMTGYIMITVNKKVVQSNAYLFTFIHARYVYTYSMDHILLPISPLKFIVYRSVTCLCILSTRHA